MRKTLLLAGLLICSLKGRSQTKEELLAPVYQTIENYTTRFILYKTPGYVAIQDPKMEHWGELITFKSSDESVTIPMNDVTIATVEEYGLRLTAPTGEATIYMDLTTKPQLRSELQEALDTYIKEAHTKHYTVRE